MTFPTFLTSNSTTRRLRPFAVAAAALAGLALTAACGSSSGNSASTGTTSTSASSSASAPGAGAAASGPHNAADEAFATDMIPHHAQAVEMAEMAATQATDPEVKALATDIKGAQDPEIRTMSGWLTGWGKPVPATGSGHMAGMTGMADNGMMSEDEMAALDKASGPAFDRMWVASMTRHHQGAVQMAKTELAKGQSTDAKALAGRIVTSQTAELTTMKAIAARLA